MKIYKLLSIIVLNITIISCGSNSANKKSDFSIKTNVKKNTVILGKPISISINNPKNHSIKSIKYSLNGTKVSETFNVDSKLGVQKLSANIKYDDKQEIVSTTITVLNDEKPKVYSFKIINEFPHDITSYTQGLEFYNGELYESTGQRGESKLRKVEYKTGKVLKNVDLDKAYFGEGLTILNDNIYQLTWQSGTGFVYDVNTLKKKSSFKYSKSKEGWGICNDKKMLYKSDGTDKIWTLNPDNLIEEDFIQVFTNKGRINNINELEWINGEIYANRYQKNGVAIINPKNGAVKAVIDFTSLKNKVTQHPKLDVLNGIAYNPETKTIFVTGKHWDKLFEVEIIEK
jgi:glutamine cyclotransferase